MFSTLKKKYFSRKRSIAAVADDADGNLSDFDSSSLGNGEDDEVGEDHDLEGPTLIAVDDGKGGFKHVRVSRPPDAQSEKSAAPGVSNTQETQPKEPPNIATLLTKELMGKHILHLESDVEKLKKRIVSKRGVVHVGRTHLERKQRRKYLADIFSTMLDMQWRYVLLVFTLSFFLSWLAFAGVWYLIFLVHTDLEPDHLPDKQAESGWQPCVVEIYNFASCFLFSIETQHTIGYGSRHTTEACPVAIFVMSFQSVIGIMIQACMVGTIFAKLSRPKRRAETLLFSKNAVVCQRDGHLCLCFRVGNMRSSHLVECHARAILVSKKVTEEGEIIPYYQTELAVGTDLEGSEDRLFFIWPATIVHKIDEESPFYHMSARDFLTRRYELIVVLESIVEPTGMTIQARTSYLPNEILWGYRFVNVLNYKRRDGEYKVDYGAFNTLFPVRTPTGSAKSLREKKEQQKSDQREEATDITHSQSSTVLSPGSSVVAERMTMQENHLSLPCLPQVVVIGSEGETK